MQDYAYWACERLLGRLQAGFPWLPILLAESGLCVGEPIAVLCRRNRWGFKIVLKEGKIPSLWQEVEALHALDGTENPVGTWQGREPTIWWRNDVEQEGRHRQTRRHRVVVWEERWVDKGLMAPRRKQRPVMPG